MAHRTNRSTPSPFVTPMRVARGEELLRKRVALARCGAVRLTFPPFDKPAEDFTVAERQWAAFAASDRLAYALVGQATDMTSTCVATRTRLPGRTGMITARAEVRREVVDDLVGRLKELAHE